MRNTIIELDRKVAKEAFETILKNNDVVSIATHDGLFHADEVFSFALLEVIYPNINIEIARTRNKDILDKMHVVLDVGGSYDPQRLRIDHHQKEGVPTYIFEEDGVERTPKMATAGMVLNLLADELWSKSIFISMSNWISQIDFQDNGDIDLVGETKATTMSGVISMFNDPEVTSNNQFVNFYEAVQLAKTLINKKIQALTAKQEFEDTVIESSRHAVNGIMCLPKGGPWVETVLENQPYFDQVKVCVYPVTESDWRVQTLPGQTRFDMKCPAPETWRGLRDQNLANVNGIADSKFVHAAGFIGGTTCKETAIKFAEKWIKQS